MRKNIIPISIIIAGLLIGGIVVYVKISKCSKESSANGEILSSQEAGERIITFINNNLLKGRATASLVEIKEENGLYKIRLAVEGQEIESYLTRDGKLFFPEGIDLEEVQPAAPTVEEKGYTIGSFSVSSDEVCKENGKPIVYFFGSEGCGYCGWEHPIIEEVAAKFEGEIAFHNNMNSDADREVFSKYSTGGIPTLVFGCKYYRVGAGTQSGEEKESQHLTALICKLTDNQPSDVCSEVQDLINEIE